MAGREGRAPQVSPGMQSTWQGPHHIRAITITVTEGGLDRVGGGGGPLALVYDGLTRLGTEGSLLNGRQGWEGTAGFTRKAVNLGPHHI